MNLEKTKDSIENVDETYDLEKIKRRLSVGPATQRQSNNMTLVYI